MSCFRKWITRLLPSTWHPFACVHRGYNRLQMRLLLVGQKSCVEMAAASCDWAVGHSDRPCYGVCAEDIRFVYLFIGYVSATDVLRARDYAILMRVGCLECVLMYSLYAF